MQVRVKVHAMQIVHFVHQIAKVIILVHPGLYQRVRHFTIKKKN